MVNYINKQKLLDNFSHCLNWEDKYLYIIELGNYLSPFPSDFRVPNYFISDCQNQVWIALTVSNNDNKDIYFYGDSDAAIVKGLIFIIFVFFQGLTLSEIITCDVKDFLDKLSFSTYLTFSRFKGLESIIKSIRFQALLLQ